MTDHIDAVNPANIPGSWDGQPAARITVAANPQGQIFDVSDVGNAPASKVASVIEVRYRGGMWSICYINQSGEEPMTAQLELAGLGWTDASRWPRRGAYLWCADPSGNIAAGRWTPPVAPLLVQDRYMGTYDLSTVHGPYIGRVAGYMDGPQSEWPASAWSRFTTIPDIAPDPIVNLEETTVELGQDGPTSVIVGNATDNGNLLMFTVDRSVSPAKVACIDLTYAVGTTPREYKLAG